VRCFPRRFLALFARSLVNLPQICFRCTYQIQPLIMPTPERMSGRSRDGECRRGIGWNVVGMASSRFCSVFERSNSSAVREATEIKVSSVVR
jgi:hypothetical protein